MTWVKLDDQFTSHPKLIQAGPLAGWLYICGLTYCARYLTDGFIPSPAVRLLADLKKNQEQVDSLVEAGLWVKCEGGYQVHDYLDYNPSSEQVRHERTAAKERMNRHRSPEVRPNNDRTSPEVLLPRTRTRPIDISPNGDMSEPAASDAPALSKNGTDPRIGELFGYYRERIQPGARVCPKNKIKARLERFSLEELKVGIDHFAGDEWEMEHNAHRGAGFLFHSHERSESYLNLKPKGASSQPYAEPPEFVRPSSND